MENALAECSAQWCVFLRAGRGTGVAKRAVLHTDSRQWHQRDTFLILPPPFLTLNSTTNAPSICSAAIHHPTCQTSSFQSWRGSTMAAASSECHPRPAVQVDAPSTSPPTLQVDISLVEAKFSAAGQGHVLKFVKEGVRASCSANSAHTPQVSTSPCTEDK